MEAGRVVKKMTMPTRQGDIRGRPKKPGDHLPAVEHNNTVLGEYNMLLTKRLLIVILLLSMSVYIVGCGGTSNSTNSSKSSWKIVDLGVLPLNNYSLAYDINDSGAVVGYSGELQFGFTDGFLWNSGSLVSVPGYGGDVAYSINNQGIVVGSTLGGQNGFVRQLNGTFTDISVPLRSINNINHAVGTGYRGAPTSGYRGFIYDGSNMTQIEPLTGDTDIWAVSINDTDTITGFSTSNPNQPVGRGYILKGNIYTQIGFLPGVANSYPEAINNLGEVVGGSGGQAFSYANGVIKALGYLPGDSYSVAYGINEQGDIVGRSGSRAFLFKNGTMIDLSALTAVQQAGWSSLYEARAINGAGQIVGQGIRNGSYHAFILTPTL